MTNTEEAIKEILEYKEGWDGEDGKPLHPRVLQNLEEVLKIDPQVLENWEISLNTNGSLYFQYKDEDTEAMINLGTGDFSYNLWHKTKLIEAGSNHKFWDTTFYDFVCRVNNFTGFVNLLEDHIKTGETAFYIVQDYTERRKERGKTFFASCNFIRRDGKVFIINQICYNLICKKPVEGEVFDPTDIDEVHYNLYDKVLELDLTDIGLMEDLLKFKFLKGDELKNFLKKVENFTNQLVTFRKTTYNPYNLSLSLPIEEKTVKIYNPDNTLLIETNREEIVDSIRLQIKEKNLQGFYMTYKEDDDTEGKLFILQDGRLKPDKNTDEFPLNQKLRLAEALIF